MYFSMFYCLCCKMDISPDISKEQVSKEIYPDMNEEEYIIMEVSREDHCRDVAEEVDNKKNIRGLRL